MRILAFNQVTFNPINRQDKQIWLTASQLAEALEYSDVRSVTKIYQRNADEFTSSMTEVVKLTTTKENSNLQTSTRIFSLRGCHLVAMFAKTKNAKEFRKWVLDILDKEVGEPVQACQTISTKQCYQIQKAIKQKCLHNGGHYQTVYNALYAQFEITSYKELLATDFDNALAFIASFELAPIVPTTPTQSYLTHTDALTLAKVLDYARLYCEFAKTISTEHGRNQTALFYNQNSHQDDDGFIICYRPNYHSDVDKALTVFRNIANRSLLAA